MEIEYKKNDWDRKSSYRTNLQKAFVATLLFFNLLVFISPQIDVAVEEDLTPNISISVEDVPATRQMRRAAPPPKPAVPVPSDDASIPEDVTIEETTLRYTTVYDDIGDAPAFRGARFTPPRPVAWVFPEYPDEEKKKGVQGIVRLSIHIDRQGKVVEAIVIDNTTGSQKCAQAAIEAAFGSRFSPAREGAKPVSHWITQPYRFDIKK